MARGSGSVFQPKYRDRKTGERHAIPTWWISYYAWDPKTGSRKKFQESAHTESKTEAAKLLKRRTGADADGKPPIADATKVTYADLRALIESDYERNHPRGLVRLKIACKRLGEVFAPTTRALEIIPVRVDGYVKARLATVEPATVQWEIAALNRMFHLAVKKQLLPHAPRFESLTISNARAGFFERAEFDALMSHLPDFLRPLITFLYHSGWRIGEVLPLRWSQIDFNLGTVRLDPGTTKNGEGREFPFAAEPVLVAMLDRQRERVTQIEHRTSQVIPWVFVRDDGSRVRDIRQSWKTACRAAGLRGKIPHDFRRTAVRNMERAGVPRSVAMSITGHRSEVVYRRYAIVDAADQRTWVAKLAAQHEADAATASSRKIIPLRAAK